jgi:hypothetical protein
VSPKRAEGLLIARSEGELLVYKELANEAHALNLTAAIVFDLCDGATSPAVMASEVALRTGLPVDEKIIDLALADLVEAGLVVLEEGEPASITRRSLVRRLALSAAAMAMLPVVETIVMPSQASADSETPTTTTTTTTTTTSTTTSTNTSSGTGTETLSLTQSSS